jgi:hypothetical protein
VIVSSAQQKECRTLSVPEAGRDYFGLERQAAYRAARAGQLPIVKIGRRMRVPICALELMLKQAAASIAK